MLMHRHALFLGVFGWNIFCQAFEAKETCSNLALHKECRRMLEGRKLVYSGI